MKIRILFLIMLAVAGISNAGAQKANKKLVITGTVYNADKQPVANAMILIDNVKTSSVTDASGKFRVKVKADATKIGVITFGAGTKEEDIAGRSEIDIYLGSSGTAQQKSQEVLPESEQGINTGYGMTKKKNLTNTVNKIDGTNKKYASYTTMGEMIQREVSGVRVAGSTVIIQGSKDLFGDVPALIVVDGVSMDNLPEIPPSSVKSIEVLKGNAAAIYGSRGYGGVIVIKTKMQNE